MRKGLLSLFLGLLFLSLGSGHAVCAQSFRSAILTNTPPIVAIPSDEAFINQVYHNLVDSSFSTYYLFDQAGPCSFVKYDYDEWFKYDLREAVPIYTLNELAKNAYFDRKTCYWQQASLRGARCVGQRTADSLLAPAHSSDPSPRPGPLVALYYFSRPVFTDDGQYAILDMDYRCDLRQCGEGATCLFRRAGAGWKLIGKKLRWGQ